MPMSRAWTLVLAKDIWCYEVFAGVGNIARGFRPGLIVAADVEASSADIARRSQKQ